MEEAEAPFLRIAEAITDESPVDWEAVRAASPELHSELERLHALEAVAIAHRQAAAVECAGAEVKPHAQERMPLFAWGPLRVLEKLGEGGFGEVFRAWDPALEREVALKLRLAEPDGLERSARRWLDEARRLARVRHPNVLVVHGADIHDGRAGLWTDLLEGRTLEALVAEQGPMSAEEAAAIGVELCRALAAVHAAGLVHGDVKAANVMSEGTPARAEDASGSGRVVLMDFGSALERSMSSGAAFFGTPLTSAPEVVEGGAPTPASDLYSLGVLLYRLVTGAYPVEAKSLAELRERLARAESPTWRETRPDLPAGFVRVLERALAHDPAGRFTDPREMETALADVIGADEGALRNKARARSPARAVTAIVGTLLLIALSAITQPWRSRRAPPLDQQVVAVFPFRVDSSDPSIDYLREGMVDLLAAKLTGEAGPRAADPRTVLSAWRRAVKNVRDDLPESEALRLTRLLGAGQALFGSVVGTPRRIALNATLIRVGGKGARAEANVEGTPDSLPALIDRLTAQLLTGWAGQAEYQLADLTTRSLPALRAYLDAQAAYRRGDYDKAKLRFREGLQIDTTFALAGVGLSLANWWGGDLEPEAGWAWAARNRLSTRDRTLLVAALGPRYPSPSSASEALQAWERAAVEAPDRAEVWFELGDELYHAGSLIGRRDAWERARAAFSRALGLDSNYAAPLEHLAEMAAHESDAASAQRLGALYFRVDSVGTDADYIRWQVARAQGDRVALAGLRARLDRMSVISLLYILIALQTEGIGLADADQMAEIAIKRAVGRSERWNALGWGRTLALNRGRPAKALALGEAQREVASSRDIVPRQYVGNALFWDGDSSAGARGVRELDVIAGAPAEGTAADREAHFADAYYVQLWRLAHGEFKTASRVIAQLRAAAAPAVSESTVTRNVYRAAILEATLASNQGRRDAAVLVGRLDSLMATGPYSTDPPMTHFGNLIVARLLEGQGDLRGALAAIRRQSVNWDEQILLSTYLREEGRLAALTGDREGAIRAYRHYLALRSDPEPALAPDAEHVREALRRLEARP